MVLLCACGSGLREPILDIRTLGQSWVWLTVLLLLQWTLQERQRDFNTHLKKLKKFNKREYFEKYFVSACEFVESRKGHTSYVKFFRISPFWNIKIYIIQYSKLRLLATFEMDKQTKQTNKQFVCVEWFYKWINDWMNECHYLPKEHIEGGEQQGVLIKGKSFSEESERLKRKIELIFPKKTQSKRPTCCVIRNTPDAEHLVLACDEVASFCLLSEAHCETHRLLLFHCEKQWTFMEEHNVTFSICTILPLMLLHSVT